MNIDLANVFVIDQQFIQMFDFIPHLRGKRFFGFQNRLNIIRNNLSVFCRHFTDALEVDLEHVAEVIRNPNLIQRWGGQ